MPDMGEPPDGSQQGCRTSPRLLQAQGGQAFDEGQDSLGGHL